MAGSRKVLVRNSALIAGGAILGNVISLLFRLIIAREYGPNSFGIFSIGFMLVSVMTTVALLGFPAGVTKYVSEYRSRGEYELALTVIGVCLSISLFLSTILMFILTIGSHTIAQDVLNSSNSGKFIQWFAFQIPANTIIILTAAFALGHERGGVQVAIKEVVPKTLLLIFTIGVIFIGGSIFKVGIGYVAARWVAAIIGMIVVCIFISRRNLPNISIQNPISESKSLIIYSTPLLFTSFTGLFLNWVDTFFVSFYMTNSDVGIYQTAFLLGSSLNVFSTAISTSLFPNFSALLSEGRTSEISQRYTEGIRWGLIITTAPFLYLLVFPDVSLGILFGFEYSSAALPLSVILIGQFSAISFGPATSILKSSDNTTFIFKTYIVAAIVNIVSNVVLIPRIGIVGAAVGTSAATFSQSGMLFLKSQSILNINLPIRTLLQVISIGGISGISLSFIFPTINSPIQFLLSILIFSLIYLIFATITGMVKRRDLSMILDVIK